MKKPIHAALAALLLPAASAQVFYGTDDVGASDNFRLDTSSGVSAGPEWTGAEAWGLADDDAAQVFYINDGATLFSQAYGNTGGAAASLGGMTYQGAVRTLTALAANGGTLWGSPNIATEGLYTIDVVTLDTTLVYTYPSSTIDIGGLDFDPATGLLYGSNDSASYVDPVSGTAVGRGIVVFDTAAMTEVWTYDYPAGETDIDGLAFDPAGLIYMLEDEPAPLHRYDIAAMAYDPNPPMNAIGASEVFSAGTYTTGSGSTSLGVNYCAAASNSTGAAASISATGSNIAQNNDLTLTAQGLPASAFGFFLTSRTQAFVPMAGGSSGNLCLGGAIGRYVGPGQIQNSGATGSISLTLDLTQTPTPTGFVGVQAGETWNFSAWFRDAVGGSATSNFSNGLELTFN